MVKDHQELNVGVLDIYGFEIFPVSPISESDIWQLEMYLGLTNKWDYGINSEHLNRLNTEGKTNLVPSPDWDNISRSSLRL